MENQTDLLASKIDSCPSGPGVYLMKNELGDVIYVGKAKNLRSRVGSYFQKQAEHSAKTLHLVAQIADIEFLRAGTEVEALLLENNLIKKWKPKYNIRLKDDKTYPYLKIDVTHRFPRVYVVRKQIKGDGADYFGPFPSGLAVREVLTLASKAFLIRDCRDHDFANRSRPCLSHQIGQCTAPCVGLVSQDDYAKQIGDYRSLLEGKTEELLGRLEREMETMAEQLEYEKAAKIRDRMSAIEHVAGQTQRMVATKDLSDRDIWALWPEPTSAQNLESGFVDVLILQFRIGKLVGRVHYAIELDERVLGESFLENLLFQHYSKHLVPETVLLPEKSLQRSSDLANALLQVAPKKQVELQDGVELHPPRLDFVGENPDLDVLYHLAAENVRGIYVDNKEHRERRMEGLEAIQKLLDLEVLPVHMECIDISNFQGEANVASCVVFKNGKPDKNEYRHFIIKGVQGQNDFASMQELISRRYCKPDSPRPDLLVVDGGRAQLASVLEIMNQFGVKFPVVGLAKARTKSDFKSEEVESSEERLFLPNQKNYKNIRDKNALKIFVQIRDEAHRFAIEFHRERRSKARGL